MLAISYDNSDVQDIEYPFYGDITQDTSNLYGEQVSLKFPKVNWLIAKSVTSILPLL